MVKVTFYDSVEDIYWSMQSLLHGTGINGYSVSTRTGTPLKSLEDTGKRGRIS